MKNQVQSGITTFQIFLALMVVGPGNSGAIVVNPSELQIQEALQTGEAAAIAKIPPNK